MDEKLVVWFWIRFVLIVAIVGMFAIFIVCFDSWYMASRGLCYNAVQIQNSQPFHQWEKCK